MFRETPADTKQQQTTTSTFLSKYVFTSWIQLQYMFTSWTEWDVTVEIHDQIPCHFWNSISNYGMAQISN